MSIFAIVFLTKMAVKCSNAAMVLDVLPVLCRARKLSFKRNVFRVETASGIITLAPMIMAGKKWIWANQIEPDEIPLPQKPLLKFKTLIG